MIDHLIKAATCRVACGAESGTGWLIGPDRVLTARHCVLAGIDNGEPVSLFFPEINDASIDSKIVAHSEDWDACILSLEITPAAEPLPVSLNLPREGEAWQTFGYPGSKSAIGHRLSGTIAQTLDVPIQKVDIDLSIDPSTVLQAYKGISGGAVVCNSVVVGIVSKKFDGTVAALSLKQLETFLADNGVTVTNEAEVPSTSSFADRGDFPEEFEEAVRKPSGGYLFLEGAHGYGKSTFCRHFQADEKKVINLGAYCLSDPESALGASYRAQPQVFLDWLATKVSRLITGQPPRKEEKSYPDQIRQTSEYLDGFSKYCAQMGRQGLFFIDGLNEIPAGRMLDELLGMLPAKLPPHVCVVLTAPNYDNIAVPLAGKVKTSDVIELPPLPDSACYRYCRIALKPERWSIALADQICGKAKGHPLYLRYLIEYANLQATDDALDEFPVLTGPIEEYYQGVWAKLVPDGDALNLLALMARLRWGVPLADFAKTLNPGEQAQFVPVIRRIRHLLADDDHTAIYHASFEAFIIEQTAEIDDSANRRLAKFCRDEPGVHYCALNRVFHLLRAADNAVFSECNQTWFDSAVTLGVEPDALIADVDAVVKRAAIEASPDEFFRLTLLAQRIGFRYDTLFAQSARLIAEALVVTGRSEEVLQHVMRLKTLIVGPNDALEIAFLLHHYGHDEEALTLLGNVERQIIENYHSPLDLGQLLDCCCFHVKTDLRIGLVTDRSRMDQFLCIIEFARGACADAFGDDAEKIVYFMQPVMAVATAHFMAFQDKYAGLSKIREETGAAADLSPMLPSLCLALLNFEDEVDQHHLPKNRNSLGGFFADLAELITSAEIDSRVAAAVADTLIRFGAPAAVVEQFVAKGDNERPRPIQLKAKNGVDVDHKYLRECLRSWRVAAFLDGTFRGPSTGILVGTGWLESLEHIIGALYCCDGRARRAKADSDEPARIACRDRLIAQVIEPLHFTLQQRAAWSDCYAIPENVVPGVYRQLAELLIDCFPEELPEWLDNILARADGQWGMYSEGFRASVFQVLEQFMREKPSEELAPKLLGLLHSWRDHVLRGVENRHELVPEILRMIPIFAALGAKEEAERLYQRLLAVSMGPTWYKEDQLGIMTEVLGSISASDAVVQRLPKVAGYLERASGEMTFQRYVRGEKSALLGQLARQGKFRAALAYFRRQCCGSTSELWAEAQQGPIDKVGPFKGNRFPGGAIDDQAAILALVRNSGTVSWVLRWALLEIFHCGDSRHLTGYAEAFAIIANEVGALPELVRRAEIVAKAETPSDERASFASAFRRELRPELHAAFATVLAGLPPVSPTKQIEPTIKNEPADDEEDSVPGWFQPGTFGRSKALRDADKVLEEAEKQWSLGNRNAARMQAVKVLQTAQEGGWGIWGNLSAGARRAEEIIVQEEVNAANVIRSYSPLLEAERYAPKWIPAQHLIRRVGPLLSESEGEHLLDAVIDHIRLVVGDAPQEIQTFAFLADGSAEENPNVEFFRFTVWLCNHPQWLRRDRATAMLLWIVEQVPEGISEGVATAFSMDEGYGPDVLCGVLDGASARDPVAWWDKVTDVLDLTKVSQELRHISRMVVLERLATRADKMGSPSAKAALGLIRAAFTGKRGTGGNPKLPIWAGCLAREWRRIAKLLNFESISAWQMELERICAPLSVTDALTLETAVRTSFREDHNRPLSRWESKLRHALNLALWPNVSRADAGVIESVLRIYNPSQPERTVLGMSNTITDQLIEAIKSDDYSAVLGANPVALLNYHDMVVEPTEDESVHVEVLCLLQPASNQWGSFGPQLDQSFRSSELPAASIVRTPFETCRRLEPEVVFFGPFTPATPLPFFQSLVSAKTDDFVQQNWRYGRRNELRSFGQPERWGCSLSVARKALKIPPGLKLVWIVWMDGQVVSVVDERNNRLI